MSTPPIPRRPYGKHAIPLSVIGFGGILVMNAEQAHAGRTVARAVERGINYFDVAPSYGDAEQRLGPALQPFRRDCFLACKTGQRDAAGARAELEQSLQNLRTDYFDLYQLHAISDVPKDVDAAFAKGGAMEVLIEAKKSGRVRHLGFSAHSSEAALAAMDRFDFDSVLFPVNFATFQADFGPAVIAAASGKGMSILALKMFARQKLAKDAPERQHHPKCWYQPVTDPREQELALRFTLSQPITAAVPPGEEDLFWRAVDLAPSFRPLTPDDQSALRAMAEGLAPVFPE